MKINAQKTEQQLWGGGGKMGKQINCTMTDKNTIFGDAEYTDAEI